MCNIEKFRQLISCVNSLPIFEDGIHYVISPNAYMQDKLDVQVLTSPEQFRLIAEELGVAVLSRPFCEVHKWIYFIVDGVEYGTTEYDENELDRRRRENEDDEA